MQNLFPTLPPITKLIKSGRPMIAGLLLLTAPAATFAVEVVLPQVELIQETTGEGIILSRVKDGEISEFDRIIPVHGRMWRSAKNSDLYYTKLRNFDTPESLFELYEDFAKTKNLAWVFKYDHEGISQEEKAQRRAKQLGDFLKAGKLDPFPKAMSNRWMSLPLKTYQDILVEPDSAYVAFRPLKEKLKGTGLLLETTIDSLSSLMAADEAMERVAVDFSLNPGGRSWEWKLAKPMMPREIHGLKMVAFDSKPYFNHEHPERGGDVHGVSGGLTKQFGLHERPDIGSATHYVFYVANTGENDFYISIEFFDYDAALDRDRDGFTNNRNNLARDYATETEEQYLIRYDETFMQKGFEADLLVASGGLVDEYEYLKQRYDSYRYREFAGDGPKAQKLRIEASQNGSPALYRVAIPITADFMQEHYINTAMGDGLVNIGPHDLQRIQYVFYVTEDDDLPIEQTRKISHYKRLLSLREYYYESTTCPADPNDPSYIGKSSAKGAVGEIARFVVDEANRDRVVITPVAAD
ncbi:MAG: hypothetical protein ABJQ29_06835 [Luteolibacter sp.]